MSLLDHPPLDHPPLTRRGTSTGHLKRAIALAATLTLVAVAILLPVMQNSDEAAQGYRIAALEQQRSDVEAQIYAAQADIAQLGAATRIDGEARSRLGMVPAKGGVAVTVNVPAPSAHTIPNRYLPAASPAPAATHDSFWKKLLRLLSFS